MTAERWWVRLAARWLARIDGVSGQLRLAMLGLTGLSTATLTLKQYGYSQFALPFIGVILVGTATYAYLFGEGGVWNQVARDKADMGDNFPGPTMLMDGRIRADQVAYLAYVMQNGGGKSFDEIRRDMQELTDRNWVEMRDGVNIQEIES